MPPKLNVAGWNHRSTREALGVEDLGKQRQACVIIGHSGSTITTSDCGRGLTSCRPAAFYRGNPTARIAERQERWVATTQHARGSTENRSPEQPIYERSATFKRAKRS